MFVAEYNEASYQLVLQTNDPRYLRLSEVRDESQDITFLSSNRMPKSGSLYLWFGWMSTSFFPVVMIKENDPRADLRSNARE